MKFHKDRSGKSNTPDARNVMTKQSSTDSQFIANFDLDLWEISLLREGLEWIMQKTKKEMKDSEDDKIKYDAAKKLKEQFGVASVSLKNEFK